VRYEFESLAEEDQYDLRENWIRQKIQLMWFLCFIKHNSYLEYLMCTTSHECQIVHNLTIE
jgi:hypothetical protein